MFLGAILKEADFSVNPNHSEKNFQSRKGQEKDFSRTSYFLKNTQDFNKPLTLSSEGAGIQKLETPSISQNFLPKPVKMLREASFGIGDFYNFIDQVDFSDVMPYFAKEDLIGFMDLDVFLANGGVVVAIRKITTCGDPSVDLIILRKLKKALFKEFFATDVWVRIRFKLK